MKLYLNMFRAPLCPSSGEQDRVLCAHSLRPSSTQLQPAQPVQNTIRGSTRSCSPDDGHDEARNTLR